MRFRVFFRTVRPFVSAIAVIATATVLVSAIYFTELGVEWITFLGGILVAAILSEATRTSRVEWVATRRSAQLSSLKNRLDQETQLRKTAEEALAASKPRLHLIDEVVPTMVALIDNEGQCQYHNRALLDWLHLRPEQVHGQHLRKILGTKSYQEMATPIRQSLDGHPVSYERAHSMPDGAIYKLRIEHLPQFTPDGRVTGFYMLMNDITAPGDVRQPAQLPNHAGVPAANHEGVTSQDTFVDSFSAQVSGEMGAAHIKAAIEKGEFQLFCQLITPIAENSAEAEHYEILVRLLEEEEGLMPPGAFFPLAEKYGLMQHLDRWVVQHVTRWASRRGPMDERRKRSIFFINVSSATIGDPGFPEFLQLTLIEYGVTGATLCFEVPNSELAARAAVVAQFAQHVRRYGCCVAIGGFGHERIAFDQLRGVRVDFLKIDGGIIFNILRDPVELAKITAINKVAKLIGVKTIAELVENEETITKLRETGIDFAQGFGISRPQPLAE